MIHTKENWLRGFWMVFFVSVLNGVIPAVSQKGLQLGLAVETVLMGRYFIGTCLIWGYILLRKRKIRLERKQICFLLVLGCLLFGSTAAMNESYRYIPGAVSAVLVFFYVVIVVVIDICMGKEKLKSTKSLCLCFSIGGLSLVLMSSVTGSLHPAGVAFSLLASLFYALQAMGMGAARVAAVSAEVVTGYMMLVPTAASFVRCLATGNPLFPAEGGQWVCILLLGIGAAFVAPVLYCAAVKQIGAGDTALINTFEPVVAYVAGILIMSQYLSWQILLGGSIVLLSVFMLNFSKLPGREEKHKKE